MVRYLLAADPLHTFLPKTDTSTLMIHELCRRGIAVDYLDLSQMDWRQSEYLSTLRVSEIKSVSLQATPPFVLTPDRLARIDEYSVILQRKDPPVDEVFIGHCRQFMRAPPEILQINSPHEIWRVSEHELPMLFPLHSIPTRVARSFQEFTQQVGTSGCPVVAKPKNTHSAHGIAFFSARTPLSELKSYWQQWGKPSGSVVVQDYAAEMESIGDLRVLSFNGEVLGSVLRKPAPGSRLGSLHLGASAHPWALTSRQLDAVRVVSQQLATLGLYFLGLDFIGQRLSEINVTCPSALPQVNAVMNITGQMRLMDCIEDLRVLRGRAL